MTTPLLPADLVAALLAIADAAPGETLYIYDSARGWFSVTLTPLPDGNPDE